MRSALCLRPALRNARPDLVLCTTANGLRRYFLKRLGILLWAPTSTPAVAVCEWFWRDMTALTWVSEGESVECRASIGKALVTVWLPNGGIIRCRRHTEGEDSLYVGRYRHGFAWNSATGTPGRQIRLNPPTIHSE